MLREVKKWSVTGSPPKVNWFFLLLGPIITPSFSKIGWLLFVCRHKQTNKTHWQDWLHNLPTSLGEVINSVCWKSVYLLYVFCSMPAVNSIIVRSVTSLLFCAKCAVAKMCAIYADLLIFSSILIWSSHWLIIPVYQCSRVLRCVWLLCSVVTVHWPCRIVFSPVIST